MKLKLANESNSLVKDIFKTRRIARKKISTIFSHTHPVLPQSSGQQTLSGLKAEYYPAAIEIGSSALKLIQIARIQQLHEIAKISYLPLESTPQSPPSPLAIKEFLKKMIEENQISGEVVSSLPINKVQTFTYILPNMPTGEIESALTWKLKQNPPAGTTFENIFFDYVSSSHSKDDFNKELRVLVFVVAKDVVMERIKLFNEFSLELIAIEPKPYAALNALFWLGGIRQEETVLLIQLGASQSSITIVHSGQPYLMRPLYISGNTFTEAIVNFHQMDWQKAETVKKQEGLGAGVLQPKEDQLKEGQLKEGQTATESICLPALSSQLENLVVDIEHTFKYFSHQLMKSQVTFFDRVVLCGGPSLLNNLTTFLMDRLSVPVDVFNPLSSFELSYLQRGFTTLVRENAGSFASLLGLAARYVE